MITRVLKIDFNDAGSGNYEKVYDLSSPAQKTAFEDEVKNKGLWLEGHTDGHPGGLCLYYKTAANETVSSDSISVRVIWACMVFRPASAVSGYAKFGLRSG
jgi:hypothetical protein